MLRPPAGVDPRIWDDAFKLETVLAALARAESQRASSTGLAWRNRVETLLEASGIVVASMRDHEKRERLKRLLGILASAGRLAFELDGDWVRFDLPQLRPSLQRAGERSRRAHPPRRK